MQHKVIESFGTRSILSYNAFAFLLCLFNAPPRCPLEIISHQRWQTLHKRFHFPNLLFFRFHCLPFELFAGGLDALRFEERNWWWKLSQMLSFVRWWHNITWMNKYLEILNFLTRDDGRRHHDAKNTHWVIEMRMGMFNDRIRAAFPKQMSRTRCEGWFDLTVFYYGKTA